MSFGKLMKCAKSLMKWREIKRPVMNAGSLRVAAQLNFQIRVQLEMASNRSEHLAEELQHMRQRIAQSDRRREKSTNKADALRAKARNDRDAKLEDDEASRRRNQPR